MNIKLITILNLCISSSFGYDFKSEKSNYEIYIENENRFYLLHENLDEKFIDPKNDINKIISEKLHNEINRLSNYKNTWNILWKNKEYKYNSYYGSICKLDKNILELIHFKIHGIIDYPENITNLPYIYMIDIDRVFMVLENPDFLNSVIKSKKSGSYILKKKINGGFEITKK